MKTKKKILTGAELIAKERRRQIHSLGFGPKNDEQYKDNELAKAASSYLATVVSPDEDAEGNLSNSRVTDDWPWDEMWWDPTDDPIRNLVKAGALIAAQIDRLQALKSKGK